MKILKILLLCALVVALGSASLALAQDTDQKKRHPSYTMTGRDAAPADSPLNPNFAMAEESRLSEGGFWRSPYINEAIVGLDVADVDRDGKNELIYATTKNVYVVKVDPAKGEQMAQIASYSTPTNHRIMSLDVLDLTGDGQPEIICSVIDELQDRNQAASTILNFTGDKQLKVAATNIPWHLRVVGSPNGRFLAGQKSSTDRTAIFSGKVMRMSFKGSTVSPQGAVGLANDFINVYSFTMGRLGTSNLQMSVGIKYPSEHLFMYEDANRAWESKEEYGGTMNALWPPNTSSAEVSRRIFLPSRILIADIDRDGQNEIIVAKNDRGGVAFMSNQRGFTSGAIQAFKYNNMSLTPFFRTRTLPGAGVDYQLADFNNNGKLDLIVAVATEQGGGMWGQSRSVIVAFELDPK